MNRTKNLGRISLILVAVLVFTAVFNMAYTGVINFGGGTADPAQVATANSSIQKSDINMDSIREQYLNFETVEKNTAAFDGERWVTVELDASSLYDEFKKSARFTDLTEYLKSVEAQKALASLRAKQTRFLNKLDKYGIDYTFKYNYSTLSAGVAIKIDASAYNTISAMSEVKGVYYSESYAVPEYTAVENNANVYSTGIYDTKDLLDVDGKTYQGQGMAVAILDTGLDHTHEAFNVTKFLERLEGVEGELRYSKDQIADLLNSEDFKAEQFGSGINDVYYNEKVPFAYDYADDDPVVFPGYSNHGTHVAGIVAGQDDTYIVNEETNETFRGVAPLAQLVICKVFTDNLYSDMIGGANDIDIVAALEDCVRLGVDVINMSLGTSAGFADENSQNHQTEVYYNVREAGISLVCAASNDYSSGYGGGNGTNLASNPDSGTVGSPSTYYSALSVASINGKKSKYLQGNGNEDQVAFITNSSDGDGNRIEFIEELYKQLNEKYGQAAVAAGADLRGGEVFNKVFGKDEQNDLNLKYVLIGGVGRPNNYSSTIRNQLRTRTYNGNPVDGTIALIKRGDTSFEEKVQEAMSNGADAVIIYNNVSGTINMSLGEITDPVPTCLITMDASAPFVDFAKSNGNIGTVQVSDRLEAGPFMSDFSSWGPVSDLTLKPEITAHGGEITSSVPGAYDVLSGTSMASPNMAGAVAVLRQYLQETTTLRGNALNARVNQMLMSTATIARNEEGNPYSPRKQGAGLAGISDAVFSEGYITVKPNEKIYSKNNSATKYSIVADEKGEEWLDKTKLELLDDPDRKGEYVLTFTVHNITKEIQQYKPTTYVMTETLASDKRTVAEKAYMLNDMCEITYTGAAYSSANGLITVPANGSVEITVTVKLKQEAKDYFEQTLSRTVIGTNGRPVSVDYKPFENGMYVEGFVSLDNVTYDNVEGKDGVTLGVPYLAFYGDWTAAPLFDYDVYEVSEIEANSAIDFENKLKATSLPSQVIGMYHNDDYIIPLGSYLYEMDEDEDDIYPVRDKIALSQYDQEGSYTVYELYAAYAGLLRNASKVRTVVTNAKTGEVVYEEILGNVGKAYSAGGGNRGAFVRYEINPSKWGWQNNDEFYFKVEGWLDYGKDGKPLDYSKEDIDPAQSTAKDDEILTEWTGVRNTFEFPLTIDYEAPQITDYTIRFDSYKEYGETKYRTYLDLDVYDNQYVMAVLPCYLKEEKEGKLGTFLTLLTEYPIPVYGEKGGTSKVSIDITDYYENYVLNGDVNDDRALYIQVEDYAMNSEVYVITLDEDSLNYPENPEDISFVCDSKLEQGARLEPNDDKSMYHTYNLTLKPFELYKLSVPSAIEKEYIMQNLSWKGASDSVIVQGDEIFALKYEVDSTVLQLYARETRNAGSADDPDLVEYDRIYAQITVQVEPGPEQPLPSASSLNFKPVHAGNGYIVNLDTLTSVEVNPNQNSDDEPFMIEPYISPWYFEAAYKERTGEEFKYEWRSANTDIATVENGKVTFIKHGNVNITCSAADRTNYRYLNKSVNFAVGEDYYVNNFYLYEWYGGEKVEIPKDVNVLYLDEDCFKNDTKITEVVLPDLLMEIPNYAFQNCTNLKKITIPSQCAYIGPHAFDGCTSLETVVFPEYVDANKDPVPNYYGSIAVGHYAFRGCTSLKNFVTGKLNGEGELDLNEISHRMTVMYDGAFDGCTGLKNIDLKALRVAGTGVFNGCKGLESVTLSESTAIGQYMFSGCTQLKDIKFNGSTLPAYAFYGCEGLTSFTFEGKELLGIGDYALAGTSITNISLPAGEYTVGSGAFANSALSTVNIADNAKLIFAGVNPFEGCNSVQFIVTGNAYKFDGGALYSFDGKTLISAPTDNAEYKLPAEVTTIGDGALSGSAVTSIDLTHITNIGKYAFADSKLTAITWNGSIEEIPEGAFSGCTDLANVTGLDNVKKVGAYAFEGCTSLAELNLPQVTEVGDHAFDMIRYGMTISAAENQLAKIEALSLQKIGAWAFAGTALTEANYQKATKVGAWAFALSDVTNAYLGALKAQNGVPGLGNHAFYKANKLRSVTLADGTDEIGDYAFSTFDPSLDNMTRQKAHLSGQSPSSEVYVMAYVLQNYMNITPSNRLTTVTLPTSVKKIGAYAFTGQSGLKTIKLDNVTEIGEGAFRLCSTLAGLDLSKVEKIGDYAFYGSALENVSLDNAQVIGEYAFAGSKYGMYSDGMDEAPTIDFRYDRTISGGKIENVTLGKATRIGAFAFAGNNIKGSVTIPATMNSSTYEFTEDIYDEKGRVERSRKRIGNTFGAGVFAYNPNLTEFKVENEGDNPAFTSIDGVLYSYQYALNDKGELEKNGMLELVQYPDGKQVSRGKYTVVDNTVSIAASAFEGVNTGRIQAVEFPYTLKLIGSSAFYGTSAEGVFASPGILNYTFNSVQAPTIVAANDDIANEMFKGIFATIYHDQGEVDNPNEHHFPWEIDPKDGDVRLDLDNIYLTSVYSNFVNYVLFCNFGNSVFAFQDAAKRVMPITFNVPKNGIGYDSALFTAYVTTMTMSNDNKPDDVSYRFINKINELKDKYDIEGIFDMSEAELAYGTSSDSELVRAVTAARNTYNTITKSDQQDAISKYYAELLKYEKALRDARKAKRVSVTLTDVSIFAQPTKTSYMKGDTFDPAGMVIKVVYSDGSELKIEAKDFAQSGVTVKNPVINTDNRTYTVNIEYKDDYANETREVKVNVKVERTSDPSGPSGPGGDGPSGDEPSGNEEAKNNSSLPAWAIAIIAVGAALVVAAVVVAVILVLKKRGKGVKSALKESAPIEGSENIAAQEEVGVKATDDEE